ncbi:MAG: energy transducer TonB [Acidobacteriota bacterium]|nr:energy transducer TonB [Acidobacteriota bacterium]
MSLNLYMEGATRTGRRPGPLAISLVLHAAAFFALMEAPEIKLPEPSKSEYKQAIEGKEDKLVWLRFNNVLPDVTPLRAITEHKPLRAAVKAPQQIVASRKDAPKQTQMVWTDAPELKQTRPVEMPNVLAIRLPQIARPFVLPGVVPQVVSKIEMPADAPQLQPRLVDPVGLGDAPKMAKPFTAPPLKIPAANTKQIAVESPPALGADSITIPNDFLAAANSRELNLAVAGLNPANKTATLPTASSPGQFSAGPKLRPDGADSAGEGKGLNVPDLYVAGGKDAKPDLIAQVFAAPTSSTTLRAAARLGGPPREAASSEQASRGAIKVSNAPDRRFDRRDVYMMAIQMPNLTSYSGSWLMWYSDRTARETGLAPITPPIAHRKVDPKYIASAAADHVEGRVQLACVIGKDGRVTTVELLRGPDGRLNQSAAEALAKWEFTPATRHGEPIEVDVLVEIPFHLAPRTQVPY